MHVLDGLLQFGSLLYVDMEKFGDVSGLKSYVSVSVSVSVEVDYVVHYVLSRSCRGKSWLNL